MLVKGGPDYIPKTPNAQIVCGQTFQTAICHTIMWPIGGQTRLHFINHRRRHQSCNAKCPHKFQRYDLIYISKQTLDFDCTKYAVVYG